MSRPRRPLRRALNGVLLLDKPKGLTSHEAMIEVRSRFNADKAGHTGTLDPLATGLLPICFGQATKLSAHLLDARKRYLAEVKLGASTRTGDSEGEILQRSNPEGLALSQLQDAARACMGRIQQVPPMYSAIKRDGTRLYELAREGVEVDREAREVEIHALSVVSFDGDVAVLDVICSKGTYIRTLAEDWAAKLGQVAHLAGLRRVAVGHYGADSPPVMITLEAIHEASDLTSLDRHLLPSRSAVQDWRAVTVTLAQSQQMDLGMTVAIEAERGWVAIDREDGAFMGLGEVLPDGRLQPRRWFGPGGA